MPSLTSHMAARLPIELWPYIVQHASRAADPPPRWGENTTTVARPRDTDIPLTVSKAWLDACMIAGVGRYWRVTLLGWGVDETEKIAQIIRTVVRSSTWTSGLEIDVADDIAGKLVPLLQSVSMSVPHIQFLKVTIRGWPTSSEHRAARHDVVSSLVVPSLRVLRLASVSIPWEAVRGLGHLTELYLGQDDESTKGRLDDLLKVLSACASTLVTLQLHHAVEEPEKCQDRVVELRALRNLLLVGGRNADRLLDVLRCHWGAATGGIPRLAFSMNVEGFDSPRLHEVAGNIRNFWARSGAPPMVPGTRELNHWQWHIAENFRGDEHPSPLLYEWYWVHDAQYWLTFCFESGGRAVNALVGTFGLDRQDVQEGDLRTTVADHWWGYGCIRA